MNSSPGSGYSLLASLYLRPIEPRFKVFIAFRAHLGGPLNNNLVFILSERIAVHADLGREMFDWLSQFIPLRDWLR